MTEGARLVRIWANRALRGYVRHAPVQRGKWRLVHALRPVLVRGSFTDEAAFFGLRMMCDVHEWMQHQVYYFGYYNNERLHTVYFRRLLRPGQLVLDIGANVGYYTLLAAEGAGPAGSVHAFEPVKRTFDRLAQNVELNGFGNVVLSRLALTNCNGEASMWVAPESSSGMSSLVAPDDVTGASERVRTERLDDYCRRAEIQEVDIVKIDVEGEELQVLRGGEQVLRRSQHARVFVEVNRALLARSDTSPEELAAFMASIGFKPHRITERGALPLTEVPDDNLVLFATAGSVS